MAISQVKWRDEFYVRSYMLASQGMDNGKIAAALGVSTGTFVKWANDKPALKQALQLARKSPKGTKTFFDYVFQRLPKHLRKLWREINACEKLPNAYERVEELLGVAETKDLFGNHARASKNDIKFGPRRGQGNSRVRQHLFLYALACNGFNPTEACRAVNINLYTFKHWMKDPKFVELMDEIHWHKKNFFESHLINLVQQGDSAATMMANKTFNKDRGYNDKVDINVTGQVNHTHTVFDIDKLDLSLEVKVAIQEALEKLKPEKRFHREERQGLPAPDEVDQDGQEEEDLSSIIDAEFTKAGQ